MNVERKGVLSPSLFISTVSCSTNLIGRCLNLYITHLHSSFYQLPTHNQAHRCICSCPACSHSVAHIHHCLAENIHPFLSRRNQNKSHFPNQPNPLYKVPCKDFNIFSFANWFWVCLLCFDSSCSSDVSYQKPAHYGAHMHGAVGGHTMLHGEQQHSWECMK